MRYRIRFQKTTAMRFTGHLDLFRAWERLARRAGLPLAYSKGFNPRPRMNLACALPLGITSQAELLDIWLDEALSAGEVQQLLNDAAPPGIVIDNVEIVNERLPALQTQVDKVHYYASLSEDVRELNNRIAALLQRDEIWRTRRDKQYDLRPLVHEIVSSRIADTGQQAIYMLLSAHEGATARPEEVLDELGIPITHARLHRLEILLSEDVNGEMDMPGEQVGHPAEQDESPDTSPVPAAGVVE